MRSNDPITNALRIRAFLRAMEQTQGYIEEQVRAGRGLSDADFEATWTGFQILPVEGQRLLFRMVLNRTNVLTADRAMGLAVQEVPERPRVEKMSA